MSKLIAKAARAYYNHSIQKSGMVRYDGGELIPMRWYKLYLDGCIAATDLPCPMYVKNGRSENLAVFFVGGGLVFDENTVDGFITGDSLFTGTPMLATGEPDPVNEQQIFVARKDNGLFSLAPENCFADWNIAVLNYGTGDFHVGTREVSYRDKRGHTVTRHLQGFRNDGICLDKVKELFPTANKLLICGESAGAFATPAMAPEVIDRYPDCQDITVFADSALLLRKDWKTVVSEFWGAPERIAQAVCSEDLTTDWFGALHRDYGGRIRCAYLCGARDQALIMFQNYMDNGILKEDHSVGVRFTQELRHQTERLKAIRPDFAIYIHDFPCRNRKGFHEHCALTLPTFRAGRVDGVSPMQWLHNCVNGKPEDVGLHLLAGPSSPADR